MDAEPTICKAVMFSDGVIREHGTGKLSLIGCFQGFNVHGFPFQTPPFYVTVMISNLRGVKGEADVTLRIEHARTRHVLQSASGKVKFLEGRVVPEGATLELPWLIPPFFFQEPGSYKAVVLFNGEEIGERALLVTPVTGQAQLEKPQ